MPARPCDKIIEREDFRMMILCGLAQWLRGTGCMINGKTCWVWEVRYLMLITLNRIGDAVRRAAESAFGPE